MNKVAIEFVQSILKQNPKTDNFGTIYDALSRAACTRSFHNLGREELAGAGISFSLLATRDLERLITAARDSLKRKDYSDQDSRAPKPTFESTTRKPTKPRRYQ